MLEDLPNVAHDCEEEVQKYTTATKDLNSEFARYARSAPPSGHGVKHEPKLLFNTTIKTDYLNHIILRVAYQNPRMGMCYMFEDNMQHMRRVIARRCVVAGARRLSERIALRQRLVMHFLCGCPIEF